MFAGGLIFLGKMMGGATEMSTRLNSQTESQIYAMLDSGESFVIPIHSQTVNRKDIAKYGVGIRNRGDEGADDYFSLKFSLTSAYLKNNEVITCDVDNPCPMMLMGKSDNRVSETFINNIKVAPGKASTQLAVFEVPKGTPTGRYNYKVEIRNAPTFDGSSTFYEPSLQILLNVK